MQYSVTQPEDLLLILARYDTLSIYQIVRLLGKESSINNIRSKVKCLVDEGLVDTRFLPRANPTGRTPMVYSLTNKGCKMLDDSGLISLPTQKQKTKGSLPLQHLLDVNDIIIAAHLLPRVESSISVFEFRHEKEFKQHPIPITENVHLCPDGFVHFVLSPPYGKPNASMGVILEVDRGTENKYTIQDKICSYQSLLWGDYEKVFGIRDLTVAFIVTEGGLARMRQLVQFTEQELAHSPDDGDLFMFTSSTLSDIDPLPFFTSSMWHQPFQKNPIPLIERRF